MKKYFLFLSFLLFINGCENIPEGTVDNSPGDFQVTSITKFDSLIYNAQDSLVPVSIQFTGNEGIAKVQLKVIEPSGDQLYYLALYDDGDTEHSDVVKGDAKYSNRFAMMYDYPNGDYRMEYFVTTESGEVLKTAAQNFNYINGLDNEPPVVSDFVVPDTVTIADNPVNIFITVKATDANGASDIKEVYYLLTREGTSTTSKWVMSDRGDTQVSGDVTAGDGIYTRALTADNSSTPGKYKFEVLAVDRINSQSNTITKYMTIIIQP